MTDGSTKNCADGRFVPSEAVTVVSPPAAAGTMNWQEKFPSASVEFPLQTVVETFHVTLNELSAAIPVPLALSLIHI